MCPWFASWGLVKKRPRTVRAGITAARVQGLDLQRGHLGPGGGASRFQCSSQPPARGGRIAGDSACSGTACHLAVVCGCHGASSGTDPDRRCRVSIRRGRCELPLAAVALEMPGTGEREAEGALQGMGTAGPPHVLPASPPRGPSAGCERGRPGLAQQQRGRHPVDVAGDEPPGTPGGVVHRRPCCRTAPGGGGNAAAPLPEPAAAPQGPGAGEAGRVVASWRWGPGPCTRSQGGSSCFCSVSAAPSHLQSGWQRGRSKGPGPCSQARRHVGVWS